VTDPLMAWFETRPTGGVTDPVPRRGDEVVAAARSRDGTADVRVIRRPDGHFSYVVVAWTNFADAGGNPHHRWHTFPSTTGFISDSYASTLAEAASDARLRGLEIEAFSGPAA
jgi:hypothetical protein